MEESISNVLSDSNHSICSYSSQKMEQLKYFNEWINVVHPQNGIQFYNAMNKVLIYTTLLINHENIMLNERSKGRENTLCSYVFL